MERLKCMLSKIKEATAYILWRNSLELMGTLTNNSNNNLTHIITCRMLLTYDIYSFLNHQ